MSSCQRSYAIAKTNVTNVFTVNTLSYYDTSSTAYLAIPYTVKNRVLDIAIQDNVLYNLLTADTFSEIGNAEYGKFENQPDYQASIMGGLSLVSSLGPNMLTFLKNYIDRAESITSSNITLYIAPTMTKVRFNSIRSEDTADFNEQAPIAGAFDLISNKTNYGVTWIFKSPLVVKFNYEGGISYLTLASAADST